MKPKQKQSQKPMIPVEDHHRDLAKKDETIRQLQDSLEKQKLDGLKMAADYKKRFVEQSTVVAQKVAAFEQALEQMDAMRKEFESRIEKLNQRHGDAFKSLRESNAELTAELARHMENAEEAMTVDDELAAEGVVEQNGAADAQEQQEG